MAPPTDRKEILERFRKQIKDGKPLVGAGAGMSTICCSAIPSTDSDIGIGLSAKFIEVRLDHATVISSIQRQLQLILNCESTRPAAAT
jgi:hypothetical protein